MINILILTTNAERRATDRARQVADVFNRSHDEANVMIVTYGAPLHGLRFDLVIVDSPPGRADEMGWHWYKEIVPYRMREHGQIIEMFDSGRWSGRY